MSARKIDQAMCKHAEAFVRHADGRWVAAANLCAFLGVEVETTGMALAHAVARGEVERRHVQGGAGGSKLQWRLRSQEPEPAPKIFSIDWPPGFVSTFATVVVPAYEQRGK